MPNSARPFNFLSVTSRDGLQSNNSPDSPVSAHSTQPPRIFYAAGPGNIVGTYQHWKSGEDDPSQVAVTYSGQFFDLCRELGAIGYAIAAHSTAEFIQDPNLTVRHLPKPVPQNSLSYHWSQIRYGLQLTAAILKFRADVAIVADGTTHWFVLAPLRWLRIEVVPSLHCVLWRKYQPVTPTERWLLKLDGLFFRYFCRGILAVSQEIADQVEALTQKHSPAIAQFLPIYRRAAFQGIAPPSQERSPFRVVFAGRMERDKGIFDLLEVAKQLVKSGRTDFVFDLCGEGSQRQALQQAVQDAGLSDTFILHGHCQKDQMRQIFNVAHVLVVPTRSDFVEGFNKVVVEGILSGRPVVTSAVCPALSYLKTAVVEVPPNSPTAYVEALLKLCDDSALYASKQAACEQLQEQFYDSSRGWAAAVQSILGTLGLSASPASPVQ